LETAERKSPWADELPSFGEIKTVGVVIPHTTIVSSPKQGALSVGSIKLRVSEHWPKLLKTRKKQLVAGIGGAGGIRTQA
jgi:hypothetical protein